MVGPSGDESSSATACRRAADFGNLLVPSAPRSRLHLKHKTRTLKISSCQPRTRQRAWLSESNGRSHFDTELTPHMSRRRRRYPWLYNKSPTFLWKSWFDELPSSKNRISCSLDARTVWLRDVDGQALHSWSRYETLDWRRWYHMWDSVYVIDSSIIIYIRAFECCPTSRRY